MADESIRVEVAYAAPDKQLIFPLRVEPGCTAALAIERSGILAVFPEIDLANASVGIFSKACKLTEVLHEGDRVEIYRPLIADPKAVRRNRAKKKAADAEAEESSE